MIISKKQEFRKKMQRNTAKKLALSGINANRLNPSIDGIFPGFLYQPNYGVGGNQSVRYRISRLNTANGDARQFQEFSEILNESARRADVGHGCHRTSTNTHFVSKI